MSKELMIERIEKAQKEIEAKKRKNTAGKISPELSFYGRNWMDQ